MKGKLGRGMKVIKSLRLVSVAIVLLLGSGLASAQSKSAQPTEQLASPNTEVAATEKYKASLETLLALEEDSVKSAAETLAKRQELLAAGVIAKREVEKSEQALTAAQAKLAEVRQQLAAAEPPANKVAAAKALTQPQIVKAKTKAVTSYSATAKMIRYHGETSWSLADLDNVQAFFTRTFGRPLPISAMGQSATHNKLGFDHRHAADVALHPDSPQGQALIEYLQSVGIPFIAFRAAIRGSATGPHIHIGRPSHRLSAA